MQATYLRSTFSFSPFLFRSKVPPLTHVWVEINPMIIMTSSLSLSLSLSLKKQKKQKQLFIKCRLSLMCRLPSEWWWRRKKKKCRWCRCDRPTPEVLAAITDRLSHVRGDGAEILTFRWLVWSVWQTDWRRSLFVPPPPPPPPPLLLLLLPSLSLSCRRYPPPRVLVIHRVDASQLDLTEPLNHGTCRNSFLSLLSPLVILLNVIWLPPFDLRSASPSNKVRVRPDQWRAGRDGPQTIRRNRELKMISGLLCLQLSFLPMLAI